MAQEAGIFPPVMVGLPEEQVDPAQNLFFSQEVTDVSGGLPINLDSLRDGPPGTKPFYPYSTLLRYVYHHG